jgi:gas vesicle protein
MKKILSFVLGAGLATVVTSLYAQRSGKELRKKIQTSLSQDKGVFTPLVADILSGRKEALSDLKKNIQTHKKPLEEKMKDIHVLMDDINAYVVEKKTVLNTETVKKLENMATIIHKNIKKHVSDNKKVPVKPLKKSEK